MVSFVFFGRFVEEKGFDALIPFLAEISVGKLPEARFFLFGDGIQKSELIGKLSGCDHFYDRSAWSDSECTKSFESLERGVHFFGFRSKPLLKRALSFSDFSVMPSRFLETFGLSALESVSEGVPVIGCAKGGLSDFVKDEALKIPFSRNSKTFTESVSKILRQASSFSAERISHLKDECRSGMAPYSEASFLLRLKKSIPKDAKKILLVTDFVGGIGGIETYVESLRRTLAKSGYAVEVHGETVVWNLIGRMSSLLKSFANFSEKSSLKAHLSKFDPDVVWCHSVLRRIGPAGMSPIADSRAFKVMTYHDLGYFAPYASECCEESDIPAVGFFAYFSMALRFPLSLPYQLLKNAKLSAMFSILKKFDLHLVPSKFLLRPTASRVGKDSKVEVLPHYVTK